MWKLKKKGKNPLLTHDTYISNDNKFLLKVIGIRGEEPEYRICTDDKNLPYIVSYKKYRMINFPSSTYNLEQKDKLIDTIEGEEKLIDSIKDIK